MSKPGGLNSPPGTLAVSEQVAALDQLSLQELRDLWQVQHGRKAPAMSKELLRLAIGYRLQEEVLGGLSRRTLLQLRTLGRSGARLEGLKIASTTPPPKSGTRFLREWQGTVHEVLALEDGKFTYGGKTYSSLTLIAREITGVHWSGPRFFGLKVMRGTKAEGIQHG